MNKLIGAGVGAVVFLGALWFAFDAGGDGRDAYWLAQAQKQLALQSKIIELVRMESEVRANELEARALAREQEAADYEKELANRPNNSCALGDSDVKRLQDILR